MSESNFSSKKLILLILALRPSDFIEMKRCAEIFTQEFQHCCIFLFHCDSREVESYFMEEADRLKESPGPHIFIRDYEFSETLQKKTAKIWKIFKKCVYWKEVFIDRIKTYIKIIKDRQIDVVILPEDIVGYISPILIKACKKSCIPSVIIPYTMCNQEEAFQSLKNKPSHLILSFYKKAFGWIFKKWTLEKDGIHLLRLKPAAIVSLELFGLSPPDPWMMNSGYADAIFVENPRMYEYYTAAGLPKNQLKPVGALYNDQLYHLQRNKSEALRQLKSELNVQSDKPIFLIGGCPNQLTANPPGFAYKSMEDLAQHVAETLQPLHERFCMIFKPHPNYPELTSLIQIHGHFYCAQHIDTTRLIALSDLYLSFASATIRWAIACEVPTINYDVFSYNYSDFKQTPGVLHVAHPKQLEDVIQQLRLSNLYKELREKVKGESLHWGPLDGQARFKINHLMNQLRMEYATERSF